MRLNLTLSFLTGFLFTACVSTSEPDPPKTEKALTGSPPAESVILNNSGAEIGKATFTPSPHGVLIRIMVQPGGLSPGWHGAHLHEVGDCSDTAKFEHSGDHFTKAEEKHGLLYEHGPESGDLPNISAAGDGSASVELFSTLTTLSDLQDANGAALIIHASPDDHLSQPIGGAGDRVACSVVPNPR